MMNSKNKQRTHGKTLKSGCLKHTINDIYKKKDFKEELAAAYKSNVGYEHDGEDILQHKPFTCCTLPSFVSDSNYLDYLRDELLCQTFIEKNNDLYKFHQTDDLQTMSSLHISAIRKFMRSEVLEWMRDITGIALSDKIHISCSRYEYTDTLLCHDDELEGRRIAFILYLVPNSWTAEDGGRLDLFTTDDHGDPGDIARSLVPARNTLAWFPVTPGSYHQVSEVLSPEKVRLSVNGWFYGPDITRPPPYIPPSPRLHTFRDTEEDAFTKWVNPAYLDPLTQGNVQEQFEEQSEIQLTDFITPEMFKQVKTAIAGSDLQWEMTGPVNKRHYHRLSADASVPSIIQQCLHALQSEAMFLTLSNLTGLRLHELAPPDSDSDDDDEPRSPDINDNACSSSQNADSNNAPSQGCSTEEQAPEAKRQRLDNGNRDEHKSKVKKPCNPRCTYEVRRWQHGSYTLVTDTEADQAACDLELRLFFCDQEWDTDFGGYTSYIAKGDDDELLTVCPADNCLALVYRDKETLGFVKHINCKAQQQIYYDISFNYYE